MCNLHSTSKRHFIWHVYWGDDLSRVDLYRLCWLARPRLFCSANVCRATAYYFRYGERESRPQHLSKMASIAWIRRKMDNSISKHVYLGLSLQAGSHFHTMIELGPSERWPLSWWRPSWSVECARRAGVSSVLAESLLPVSQECRHDMLDPYPKCLK